METQLKLKNREYLAAIVIQRAYHKFSARQNELKRIQQLNIERVRNFENEALSTKMYEDRLLAATRLIQRYWRRKRLAKKQGRTITYDDHNPFVE
jgi:hypothetical protein